MDLVYTIINFFIFVGLLYFLLKKPAKSAMYERNTKVGEDIRLSKELKDYAHQALKKSTEKIDNLDAHKKTLKNEVEKDIEDIERTQKQRVEEALRRIEEEAKQKSAFQAINIKGRLEKETAQKLLHEAQKLFQNNLDSKAHDKLNKEYLEKLNEVQGLR